MVGWGGRWKHWLSNGTTARLPAIVLTYDRYHPFTRHMIAAYGRVWPSHPFEFHVPYQRTPLVAEGVIARRTPDAIRATVLELLEPFDDEAWVYWCIDDKYPIRIVSRPIARLARVVAEGDLPGVDGLLFCRCRRLLQPERLLGEERNGPAGIRWLRRKDYSQIWIHQFLRVKVLRYLFERFSETIPQAKMMDPMKEAIPLPTDHRLYVVRDNLATFGESTSRGRITQNCAESLRAFGFEVPEGFERSDQENVMGVIESAMVRAGIVRGR